MPCSIIPVVYHNSLGEGNRSILDELRKITTDQMKRIHHSRPEDQARLDQSQERLARKKLELDRLKL